MVVRDQSSFTGFDLEPGDKLRGHYDLKVDSRPEELYEEFKDYDFQGSEVQAAAEYVDEKITPLYDVAQERGMDPETLDDERLEELGGRSGVELSDVWDGEWEGLCAGTCRERAATLHLLYDEMGVDSVYQKGAVDDGDYREHAWVRLDDGRIADPSTDSALLEGRETPHSPGQTVVRRAV